MYEAYYSLREKPFALLPDPAFVFLGKKHSMALAMLEYGLANQAGFAVLVGEIGSGKTTLVRCLLDRLEQDVTVGLITNAHSAFGELLEWVLLAFGLEGGDAGKAARYQLLTDFLIEEYAQGRRTLLIVDEAQNLAPQTLEELRMLSNVNADKHQVLQIVLAGQPELREVLRRPDLKQLVQRVSVAYFLEALDADETLAYIRHRLSVAGGSPDLFEPSAVARIHARSRGVPRLINTLCDTALVYGFAAQAPRVTAELISEVVNDRLATGLFDEIDGGGRREPASSAAAGTAKPKAR